MSDQYVGEIRMFSGNYAPEGWALCNGQTLSINENEALFSLIGTIYGGDGRSTFALPDLQGRLPIHYGTNAQSGTAYPFGTKGGTEQVTLSASELPAHTHTVNAQSLPGSSAAPDNHYWAASSINQYATTAPNSVMSAQAVTSVGGNQAHNNMMPFFPLTFIIAVQGNYPTPT